MENELFKRAIPDFSKLIAYGFVKDKDTYKYSKNIMNDSFRVEIIIDNNVVTGKIYDINFGEEYTNFRIENQVGEFVNTVKDEYKNILRDILDKCFIKKQFVTDQANRITKMIRDVYNDDPEFVWDDYPCDGIFRNPNNRKWYGLIMNIDRSKIDDDKGEIEVLNVKIDSNKIPKLLEQKGYYKAYHMNKKNWLTIILDDTLSDDEIMDRIKESHSYTESSNEWIIPSNPKYFDVESYLENNQEINWKQSSNIQVGDIVYLYLGSPYSAILYKLEVLKVNIPYNYKNQNITMSNIMTLKLLKKYDKDKFTFDILKEYGVNAVRGPRFMPKELSKKINEN